MNSQLQLDGQLFINVYDENNNIVEQIHQTNQITPQGLSVLKKMLLQGLNRTYPYISDIDHKAISLVSNQYLHGGQTGQIPFLKPLDKQIVSIKNTDSDIYYPYNLFKNNQDKTILKRTTSEKTYKYDINLKSNEQNFTLSLRQDSGVTPIDNVQYNYSTIQFTNVILTHSNIKYNSCKIFNKNLDVTNKFQIVYNNVLQQTIITLKSTETYLLGDYVVKYDYYEIDENKKYISGIKIDLKSRDNSRVNSVFSIGLSFDCGKSVIENVFPNLSGNLNTSSSTGLPINNKTHSYFLNILPYFIELPNQISFSFKSEGYGDIYIQKFEFVTMQTPPNSVLGLYLENNESSSSSGEKNEFVSSITKRKIIESNSSSSDNISSICYYSKMQYDQAVGMQFDTIGLIDMQQPMYYKQDQTLTVLHEEKLGKAKIYTVQINNKSRYNQKLTEIRLDNTLVKTKNKRYDFMYKININW